MIDVILVTNQIPTFPILKFDAICLLANDIQSQNIEEHLTEIRSNYKGHSHASHIYAHIYQAFSCLTGLSAFE